MTVALFVVGASGGAIVRYLVGLLGFRWHGTLALNVTGSFALGFLLASDASTDTKTWLGTGLLGSLTTFSSFSLEAVEAPRRERIAIVAVSVVLGVGAAALGYALA